MAPVPGISKPAVLKMLHGFEEDRLSEPPQIVPPAIQYLYRFRAVRGTIITTSDFSKGTRSAAFEQGAPPSTLINRDKLVELLDDIGARRKHIEVWELDSSASTSGEE